MQARVNAKPASLQSPRPFSVYGSTRNPAGSRFSPKAREHLVAGKNERAVSTYSRSPSRSPTNTIRDKSKKSRSLDVPDGKGFSGLSGNEQSGDATLDINDNTFQKPREVDSPSRRAAMMPVSNSTTTWKIVKNSRCLVNGEALFGVHINRSGDIYTTSDTAKGGLLQCFDRNGSCLNSFYLKPYKGGKSYEPFQVHETPNGQIAVACRSCVTIWSKEGKLVMEHGKNMFKFCKNVAVRSTGEIVASDSDGDCVKLISPGGQQITKLDQKIYCAGGIAVDSKDYIIVTNWSHKVYIFDDHNRLVRSFGVKGHDDGELDMAYGVTIDSEDNIVIADMWNDRVSVYSNEGSFISHMATSSMVHRPVHIAVTKEPNGEDNRLAVIEFGGSTEVKLLSY